MALVFVCILAPPASGDASPVPPTQANNPPKNSPTKPPNNPPVNPPSGGSGGGPTLWTGQDVEVKFIAPMAFYAGDKLMPAGTYEVKQGAGVQGNTLLLRGKGKNETYLPFTAIILSNPVKSTEVTFNKYGDKEYLDSIRLPTGGGGATTETNWLLKVEPSAGEQAAAKAAAAAPHNVPATATKK